MSDEIANEEMLRDGQGEKPLATATEDQPGQSSQSCQTAEVSTGEPSAARSVETSDQDAENNQDDRISPATVSAEVASDTSVLPARKSRNRIAACIAAAVLAVAIVAGIGYASGVFGGGNVDEATVSAEQSPANNQGVNADEGEPSKTEDQLTDNSSNQSSNVQSSESEEASVDQSQQQQDADQQTSADSLAPASAESTSSKTQPAASVTSSTSASTSESNSQSSSNSSSAKSDSDSSTSQESSQKAANTISVYISVDSSRAAEYGLSGPQAGQTIELAEGSSVYDALCALGYSVSGSSTYVSAIGGLAEKQCGSGSGWTYAVNGSFPGKACGRYILSGGESVTWIYSTEKNPTISM